MRGLLKSLVLSALLVSVVWIVGCTSQEEGQASKEEMAEEAMMLSTVFLKHQVADYTAWRPVYDADISRRAEAGLKEVGVYRDADNENMVLVVGQTADIEAFNAMVASPDLAAKMQEAGVVSKPETWVGEAPHAGAGMAFLRHKVADYAAWRPFYDADAPRRMEAGLQEMGVYRDADDENMILMVWQVEDGSSLNALLESPELAAKMQEAGVTGKPEAWMASMEMTATKE